MFFFFKSADLVEMKSMSMDAISKDEETLFSMTVCLLASLQNSVLKSQFGLKLQSVENSKVNSLVPRSTAPGHVVSFKM